MGALQINEIAILKYDLIIRLKINWTTPLLCNVW